MLVIHVPHASTHIPLAAYRDYLLTPDQLDAEAKISADLHTDALAHAAWPGAVIVQASISRVVVDVERYDDDATEKMAARGRGVVYTHTHDMKQMRAALDQTKRQTLLDTWYYPYWKRLRQEAKGWVLVDLHSYPVDPWPAELDHQSARPEIDVGTTPGLTPTSWTSAIVHHFRMNGFDVGENTPYAGVIDAGADAAAMIEIRRDVIGAGPSDTRWPALVSALSTLPLPA